MTDDLIRHGIFFFVMFSILFYTHHKEGKLKLVYIYLLLLPIIGEMIQLMYPRIFDFDIRDIGFNYIGSVSSFSLGKLIYKT